MNYKLGKMPLVEKREYIKSLVIKRLEEYGVPNPEGGERLSLSRSELGDTLWKK